VRAATWDGKELNPEPLATLITMGSSQIARLGLALKTDWPMLAAMGELKPNRPLILGFVLVFAALVGPVNLFGFAPAARRHRMFWTTPLISLGGSLVLIAVIFLQEGAGGTGRRFTMVRLFPETHEALVWQEQVSRTGLLIGGGFWLNEDALAIPMQLNGIRNQRCVLAVDGRNYSGDWFKNRSIQAQRFAAVRSTRAALTLLGPDASGAPTVVSSMESTLETLIVVDEHGGFWRGDNVRTGEKATLHAVDRKESTRIWEDAVASARQASMREALDTVNRAPAEKGRPPAARFFASVTHPKGEPMETLRSIRWVEDRVVYLGPVTRASATQAGGTAP